MARPIRSLAAALALCCALLGFAPSGAGAAPLAQSCQAYTLGADWISVSVAVPSTLQAPAGVEYRTAGAAFFYVMPASGLVELAPGSYQLRNFTGPATAQICPSGVVATATPSGITPTATSNPSLCQNQRQGYELVYAGANLPFVAYTSTEYQSAQVIIPWFPRVSGFYIDLYGVNSALNYKGVQVMAGHRSSNPVSYMLQNVAGGGNFSFSVGTLNPAAESLYLHLYYDNRFGQGPPQYANSICVWGLPVATPTSTPTMTVPSATVVSPSCVQFDTPATVYLGAANTVRAVRGPVWFVDHGLFDERVYLDSTARFWVAGYGQKAGYVTLEGPGGIAEVCEQYPTAATATSVTATASPTAINPFPTRTPTPTRTRTPTRTPTPSNTPTGTLPPTSTATSTATATATSTALPTSTPHADCVANPLDPGCMLQTVVAVPSAIVTPSPGWAVPTARATMGPGAVGTALAGKEPFSSFEAGSDLVRELGLILETAPEGCSLDVLSGIDQVSPWSPPTGARFNVPTPAQMAPAVCWLYNQWLPFFQIIRALSLFAWMWGFFLYLRRRIAAFGQAGGE